MSLFSRYLYCCSGRRKRDETPAEDTKVDEEWEKVEYENEIDTTVENDDCFNFFNKTKKVLVIYEREIKNFFINLLKFHIEKFYQKSSIKRNKRNIHKLTKIHIVPKLEYQSVNNCLDYDSEKERFKDYSEKKKFITNHFNDLRKRYYHN